MAPKNAAAAAKTQAVKDALSEMGFASTPQNIEFITEKLADNPDGISANTMILRWSHQLSPAKPRRVA